MEKIINLIKGILTSPISELNVIEIFSVIVVLVFVVYFTKYFVIYLFKFLKFLVKCIRMTISAKQKCKKIQCYSCGRTLDKCACEKNSGRGSLSRLYHYKKEQKELKIKGR